MNAPDALVLDFLEWIADGPQPYGDVMDAWRTSCPRLPVWEDSIDRGLVRRQRRGIELTDAGRALLQAARPSGLQ